MTSPEAKPEAKPEEGGGGMLPALLAGAGILIVAGLLIFGGDDDEAKRGANDKANSASIQSKSGAGGRTGVAARSADNASGRPVANTPKLNPRIANSIATGGGMAPAKPPEPTSFASVSDEITYWEDQLRDANRMLEIRERAVEHIPQIEEAIRNGNDPVNGLKEFEARKKVVADNLDRATKRVEEVEGKLTKLRGG